MGFKSSQQQQQQQQQKNLGLPIDICTKSYDSTDLSQNLAYAWITTYKLNRVRLGFSAHLLKYGYMTITWHVPNSN